MKRRSFLLGAGGAVVAAPYLASVWERTAKGQPPPPRPRQLIVMFTHYGCVTTKWFPVKSHGPLVAADLANSLTPLQPYVGKVLIPRGIRAMNEWTVDNKNGGGIGQSNDPNLQVVGSYFTLQPVTPSGTDPFSFDTAYKFNAKPVGSSLDHVMAQQISPGGTPLFMRIGNRNDSAQSGISYVKTDPAPNVAATPHSGFGKPMDVFTALTGLLGPGPMSPDSYELLRGKKVCDVVKGELADLKRLDMSAEDRMKVDVWETLCNDVGTAVTSQCNRDLVTKLGASPEIFAAGATNITSMVTPELDGADLYSVLAVLATACNYNPVIFLKYPPNYVYAGLGINADSHNLSHRADNAGLSGTCYPNALSLIQVIDKYYVSKFAKLVGMLDGVKNTDGSTLLDSTAAVMFNEMSDGLAQNLNNLPIIQAGSCGGYFKTGWTVNVDTMNTGSPTLTQGNSEVQCTDGSGNGTYNGVSKETGTDPKVANAPINKYYYNLMNALGVKGDANGYPAKGGVGEVTRFGYSDLTTDFCGGYGWVAGAGIHSPGEYTALKADS